MFPESLLASIAASTHVESDLAAAIPQQTYHYCDGQVKMEGGVGLCLTHSSHELY